jgi:phosphoenolpyruvate carboxykinase (ATP)
MALHPTVYAKLLAERTKKHNSHVWLVNTGWSGGAYGVGSRIRIGYTRAMIKAALSGELASIATTKHPVFDIAVPQSCPGVPSEILNPRNTWNDTGKYDEVAKSLARLFRENFAQFTGGVTDEIAQAGPKA